MTTIGAAKFKAQCLAILDELAPEGLVITKHGRPVARLIPFEHEPGRLIGSLAGRVKVQGDLLSTGLSWDADGRP